MKLSLSSLLFVFLADKLNQACATPSSLRCCTWSLATCTVEQFPVKRKDRECSVIVQKDRGGKKISNCWHGTGWSYHCGCAGQPSWTWHQHGTHNVPLASLQPLLCLARKRISHAMVSTNIQPRSLLSAWQFGLSFLCVHPGRGW